MVYGVLYFIGLWREKRAAISRFCCENNRDKASSLYYADIPFSLPACAQEIAYSSALYAILRLEHLLHTHTRKEYPLSPHFISFSLTQQSIRPTIPVIECWAFLFHFFRRRRRQKYCQKFPFYSNAVAISVDGVLCDFFCFVFWHGRYFCAVWSEEMLSPHLWMFQITWKFCVRAEKGQRNNGRKNNNINRTNENIRRTGNKMILSICFGWAVETWNWMTLSHAWWWR